MPDDMYAKGIAAGEQLLGTCKSIANLGEEYEELQDNVEFCSGLDDTAFCCPSCNWWCALDEETDNGECKDCNPDGDASGEECRS